MSAKKVRFEKDEKREGRRAKPIEASPIGLSGRLTKTKKKEEERRRRISSSRRKEGRSSGRKKAGGGVVTQRETVTEKMSKESSYHHKRRLFLDVVIVEANSGGRILPAHRSSSSKLLTSIFSSDWNYSNLQIFVEATVGKQTYQTSVSAHDETICWNEDCTL